MDFTLRASCNILATQSQYRREGEKMAQEGSFQDLKCLRLLWHHTGIFAWGVNNKI